MSKTKLKIGISIGDINGIGLEVILKTLADKRILNFCTPVLYGSAKVASYHKNIINIKELSLHNASNIHSIKPNAVNVITCWMENVKITLGKCTIDGGRYATFSLEQATNDLKAGLIDALVTAPINKKAMQLSGFEYAGHTEYLTTKFDAEQNLMLMVHEGLRVGLVTNHLPVNQITSNITQELILEKIQLMDQSLRMDFGIDKPAIAILGLNPHAGDEGVLGDEESNIIMPAIEEAKKLGVLAIGPYAADGFFGSDNHKNFDGILAMYHDQGLVPFKTLSFGNGVNFTAGLPIIRTSPDHGTGYDIAGNNLADPQSFRQALYLAIDSTKLRADYIKMTANPLKKFNLKEYDKAENKLSEKKKKNQQELKEDTTKSTTDEEDIYTPETITTSDKQLTIEEKLALAEEKKNEETSINLENPELIQKEINSKSESVNENSINKENTEEILSSENDSELLEEDNITNEIVDVEDNEQKDTSQNISEEITGNEDQVSDENDTTNGDVVEKDKVN